MKRVSDIAHLFFSVSAGLPPLFFVSAMQVDLRTHGLAMVLAFDSGINAFAPPAISGRGDDRHIFQRVSVADGLEMGGTTRGC